MKKYCIYFTLLFLILFSVDIIAQKGKFIGFATAKVNLDSIVEVNAYGFKNKEKLIEYTANTIQPIGSVSKTFIGISLMILDEKGLIDLNADINNYLDFEVYNPNVKKNNIITLRHLATHTSGIIDVHKKYKTAYTKGPYKKGNLRSFLYNYLSKNGELYAKKNFNKSKGGSEYSYSNIAAALAAYIVEKVSGESFNHFTAKHIFEPLGMRNTAWFYKNIDLTKRAILYDEQGKALELYSLSTYPDGSLKTSINDLSIYLIELIKGYNGKSTLMSNDSWKKFYRMNFSDSNLIKNINEKEPNTGIFIIYFKSGKIGHTGSDPGVSCIMMFDPKTNMGQIFMSNEDLTKNNLNEFKRIWKGLE